MPRSGEPHGKRLGSPIRASDPHGACTATETIAGRAVIIEMVLRAQSAGLVAVLLLAGCGRDMKSKEKIQEAILQRLQTRSGLDLKSLEVTTTSVSFEKNLAYASVAFHPKGDSNVNSGMVMKYTLENRDGKWVVVKVGDSQNHTGMLQSGADGTDPGADQLPPGHPPVDALKPPAAPGPESGSSGRTQ